MKKLIVLAALTLNTFAGDMNVENYRFSKPDSINDYINLRDVKATFDKVPYQNFGQYTAMTLGWSTIHLGETGFATEEEAREKALETLANIGSLNLSDELVRDIDFGIDQDLTSDREREEYIQTVGSLVNAGYVVVKSSSVGPAKGTIFNANRGFKYSMTVRIPGEIKKRAVTSSYGAGNF